MKKILICDRNSATRYFLSKFLDEKKYKVFEAENEEKLTLSLQKYSIDVLVVDVETLTSDFYDVVAKFSSECEVMDVIMVTSKPDLKKAVWSFKSGIKEYLTKPLSGEIFAGIIEKTLQKRTEQLEKKNRSSFERTNQNTQRFMGNSQAICELNLMLDKTAKTPNTTVLLAGESGTGKGYAAKLIHEKSVRAEQPFIHVNCAAIPYHLAESELFGHVKGAFTGARDEQVGLLELADGGTLFLDEIAELDIRLQPKILRFLEDLVVTPVGAQKGRKVDVRVIAATNRNLRKMVSEEQFRKDLFFRLDVMRLRIPSLREYMDDFEFVAEYFLRDRSIELGKRIFSFAPNVMEFLKKHNWPGNLRELKNIIERLAIFTDTGIVHFERDQLNNLVLDIHAKPADVMHISDMVEKEQKHSPFAETEQTSNNVEEKAESNAVEAIIRNSSDEDSIMTMAEIEEAAIVHALKLCNNNRTEAALKLEISRSTLMRKIALYEIQVTGGDEDPSDLDTVVDDEDSELGKFQSRVS